MQDDERVVVGMIGCGVQGQLMLARFQKQESQFRVGAVFDTNEETERTVDSFEGVFSCDGLSLVYISTPPDTHLSLIRAAAAAGLPTLCEKPLCGKKDLEEAGQLEDTPALAFNFCFRHNNAVNETLRRLLKPLSLVRIDFTCHFTQWPRAWQPAGAWLSGGGSGGYTREVFSHFAFLLVDLLGTLEFVSSSVERAAPSEAETCVVAHMRCGETPVRLVGSVGGGQEEVVLIFRGEAGSEVRLSDWETISSNGDILEMLDEQPASLFDELQRLARGQPHQLPSLPQALQVLKVVEAILQ